MEQQDEIITNEATNSTIETEPVTNENMISMPDASEMNDAKKTIHLLSPSPLIATNKTHRPKTFGSPLPANLSSYEISPHTQAPGNHHQPGYSPFPASWPAISPPPAHHPYAYPYPPSSFPPPPHNDYSRSSRSMTEMEKGTRLDHSAENGSHKPPPYRQYRPHPGYYPPYPYPCPPFYTNPPPSPASHLTPHHYAAGDHRHIARPYSYPYLPPTESLGSQEQKHSHPIINDDTGRKDEMRLKMPNDGIAASPVEVLMHVDARSVTDEAQQMRERKNTLSRVRAQKQREQIEYIRAKPEWERTESEYQLLHQYESKRGHKNNRSRRRATETKQALEVILQKPEEKRSAIEVQLLRAQLHKKNRKNEGDRMRRERLKALGLTPKSKAPHIRVTARGPIAVQFSSGTFCHAGVPPLAYAFPYLPPVQGNSHPPIPPRPFSPISATGGTSFIVDNGKASVESPAEQP